MSDLAHSLWELTINLDIYDRDVYPTKIIINTRNWLFFAKKKPIKHILYISKQMSVLINLMIEVFPHTVSFFRIIKSHNSQAQIHFNFCQPSREKRNNIIRTKQLTLKKRILCVIKNVERMPDYFN